MRPSIAAIILTYNEEVNIEKCLKSIVGLAQEIFVVDSYSKDKTLEIAKKFNVKIVQRPFKNQAEQFNWALDNIDIKSDWILKLDADEYLTPELRNEIIATLNMKISDASKTEDILIPNSKFQIPNSDINGYYIKRRVYFMCKWIKHGGYYPVWFLRLWRKGTARSEERKMDEHIVLLEGKAEKLKNDFVDDNRKGLRAWLAKHKKYAAREAEEVLAGNYGESKKRAFYYKLPPFFRVFVYFVYRYFFRLGFLDGSQGAVFHFLHGFWYRLLVDAKIYKNRIKISLTEII